MNRENQKTTRFEWYAWVVLAYNLFVIIWGAYVRASGSGAGCGAHWPLCNGEVLPQDPRLETLVELFHRLTSGIALLLVVVLIIWARRSFPKGHRVRLGAGLSMFFIITESLVGAMLVLFEWTAFNQSLERVVSVSVHLVNTFFLIGSLALTGWWAHGQPGVQVRGQPRRLVATLAVAFMGMLVLGVSGAITALGDTLFPAGSLAEGIAQDFLPTAHFLVRLRVYHPITAIVVGLLLAFFGLVVYGISDNRLRRRLAKGLVFLFGVQLIAGLVNLVLLAPVYMQLIHLLLADLVWLNLVLLAANLLAVVPAPAPKRQISPVE